MHFAQKTCRFVLTNMCNNVKIYVQVCENAITAFIFGRIWAKSTIVCFEDGFMKKSVKVYMMQDLILLTILGVVLEALTQKYVPVVLGGAPTITFALFIAFVAVTRWGLWGLIIVPILALSTWLGGSWCDLKYVAHAYDWRIFLSESVGLLTLSINVLFYRNHKTKRVINTTWKLLLIMALDYVLYCAVQLVVYRLLTSGNPLKVGELGEYIEQMTSGSFDANGNWVETTNYNVFINYCLNTERGFAYNLFGLAVLIVGVLIFRSQGIINNAVDKIVDDKKMADAEAQYLKNLGNGQSSISEAETEKTLEAEEEEEENEASEVEK